MPASDELLDELDHLATVEHALCVQYLFLDCALVEPGSAFNLALTAMSQIRQVNDVLVTAGLTGNLARAEAVRATPPVPFAPLVAGGIDLARQSLIAVAVDRRYATARALLDSDPAVDSDLRDRIAGALDGGAGHAAAFESLRESLPEVYLRRVREPADEGETTLRSIGLREYNLIVQLLQEHFTGANGLTLLAIARDAMRTLQEVFFLLTERDLLPRFD